jgi:ArsR family transcriptional regulator
LSEEESVCACDFTSCCDVSQPTVSHHLKVLREAGWVDSERRGTWIWYRLRPEAVTRFRELAGGFSPGPARPVTGTNRPAQRRSAPGVMTGRPAAFCFGPGHVVMHGNPAFQASFGASSIGLPAREILVDLPTAAFDLMDTVFAAGRPLAIWLPGPDQDWRLTVVPRRDPETARPTA